MFFIYNIIVDIFLVLFVFLMQKLSHQTNVTDHSAVIIVLRDVTRTSSSIVLFYRQYCRCGAKICLLLYLLQPGFWKFMDVRNFMRMMAGIKFNVFIFQNCYLIECVRNILHVLHVSFGQVYVYACMYVYIYLIIIPRIGCKTMAQSS